MKNPYSIGSVIYLRSPLEVDLHGPWYEWLSDEETTQFLSDRYWPNSIDLQREFFESLKNDRSRLALSIIDIKTEKHIGICSLSYINWIHGYADFAVIIGDKEHRSGHAAIEAIDLLLEIAFLRLNMLNVKGSYLSVNKATEQLMKLFQFEITGVNKALINFRGKKVDLVNVQISKEQWSTRNSGKIGMPIRVS